MSQFPATAVLGSVGGWVGVWDHHRTERADQAILGEAQRAGLEGIPKKIIVT